MTNIVVKVQVAGDENLLRWKIGSPQMENWVERRFPLETPIAKDDIGQANPAPRCFRWANRTS